MQNSPTDARKCFSMCSEVILQSDGGRGALQKCFQLHSTFLLRVGSIFVTILQTSLHQFLCCRNLNSKFVSFLSSHPGISCRTSPCVKFHGTFPIQPVLFMLQPLNALARPNASIKTPLPNKTRDHAFCALTFAGPNPFLISSSCSSPV